MPRRLPLERPARRAAMRLTLALVVLGLAAAPAGASPAGNGPGGTRPGAPAAAPATEGRMVVTTTASAAELAAVPGIEVRDRRAATGLGTVLVQATPAAAVGLAARPDVEAVEADVPIAVDSDPLHASNWAVPRIGLADAWRRGDGSGIVVAILDTGVQPHVELTGRLLVGTDVLTGLVDGRGDANGHGTKSALTVAAARGDAYGAIGVCPECRILPVKVLGDDGGGSLWTITQGIDAALTLGADIINVSASGVTSSSPRFLQDAVARATHAGVPIVASAGNAGDTVPAYPAADDGVIGVAASTVDDTRYGWSTYGSWVDVAAPGCYRVSDPWTPSNGGWYCGTSAAAPVVSATLALARAAGAPKDVAALRQAVSTTSQPLSWLAGGRLDACGVAGRGQRPQAVVSSPAPDTSVATGTVIDLTASDDCGLTSVQVSLVGGPVTTLDLGGVRRTSRSVTLDTTGVAAGPATLRVTAVDVHGRSQRVDVPVEKGLGTLGGGIPVVGDWNGDGHETPGRFSRGRWQLSNDLSGKVHIDVSYGRAGDVPIVGDWNGDGRDTLGIVRGRNWRLSDGFGVAPFLRFNYGDTGRGDVPLVGDWNGNGRDTIGIVRDRSWRLRNTLSGGRGHLIFKFGSVTSGDVPVVGDWTADDQSGIGIARGERWLLRNEPSGGFVQLSVS
jgi:thermitase